MGHYVIINLLSVPVGGLCLAKLVEEQQDVVQIVHIVLMPRPLIVEVQRLPDNDPVA